MGYIKNIVHKHLINEIGNKRKGDTDIIYKDSNLLVLVPLSFDSSKSYSRGTKYCTGGDCGNSSDVYFNTHTNKGDFLFRIFFKDGSKIRLTWNGNTNDDSWSWGLGDKNNYIVFVPKYQNMDHPFDFENLKKVRDQKPTWWDDRYEKLYKYIIQIPKNAINNMVNYTKKGG